MKKCTKCLLEKSLNSFHNHMKSKDGLDYWCKDCKKAQDISYNFKPNYEGSKDCQRCNEHKDKESFYKCKRNPDGLENRCKKCCQQRSRNNEIKRRYGINQSDYEKILKSQDGKCAICEKNNIDSEEVRRLSIDHCHETGKIRGLLCSNCNFAIGLMEDDPVILKRAINYLEK